MQALSQIYPMTEHPKAGTSAPAGGSPSTFATTHPVASSAFDAISVQSLTCPSCQKTMVLPLDSSILFPICRAFFNRVQTTIQTYMNEIDLSHATPTENDGVLIENNETVWQGTLHDGRLWDGAGTLVMRDGTRISALWKGGNFASEKLGEHPQVKITYLDGSSGSAHVTGSKIFRIFSSTFFHGDLELSVEMKSVIPSYVTVKYSDTSKYSGVYTHGQIDRGIARGVTDDGSLIAVQLDARQPIGDFMTLGTAIGSLPKHGKITFGEEPISSKFSSLLRPTLDAQKIRSTLREGHSKSHPLFDRLNAYVNISFCGGGTWAGTVLEGTPITGEGSGPGNIAPFNEEFFRGIPERIRSFVPENWTRKKKELMTLEKRYEYNEWQNSL